MLGSGLNKASCYLASDINHIPPWDKLVIFTTKFPLKCLEQENCDLAIQLTFIRIKELTGMQLNFHPTVIQLCDVLLLDVLISSRQSLTWPHLGQSADILVDEMQHRWDLHLVNGLVNKE